LVGDKKEPVLQGLFSCDRLLLWVLTSILFDS
jgi:hypothetical protein